MQRRKEVYDTAVKYIYKCMYSGGKKRQKEKRNDINRTTEYSLSRRVSVAVDCDVLQPKHSRHGLQKTQMKSLTVEAAVVVGGNA